MTIHKYKKGDIIIVSDSNDPNCGLYRFVKYGKPKVTNIITYNICELTNYYYADRFSITYVLPEFNTKRATLQDLWAGYNEV